MKMKPQSEKDLLIELAWGLIANAHGGDWQNASPKWRRAAERWRDLCFGKVPARRKPAAGGTESRREPQKWHS